MKLNRKKLIDNIWVFAAFISGGLLPIFEFGGNTRGTTLQIAIMGLCMLGSFTALYLFPQLLYRRFQKRGEVK